MDDAAPIAGHSLGERLYRAERDVAATAGLPGTNAEPFALQPASVQALYDRAAVRFVASLTYAESEGVREALLSSLLLEALKAIRDLEPEPYQGFPAGWDEQVKACPECARYADHPIQRGICDIHRRDLWKRDHWDEDRRNAIGWRAKSLAREAVAQAEARAIPSTFTTIGEAANRVVAGLEPKA